MQIFWPKCANVLLIEYYFNNKNANNNRNDNVNNNRGGLKYQLEGKGELETTNILLTITGQFECVILYKR